MESSMPSYDAIAIFVQVVRSGSFTDAAKALSTPLSTVSRKVAELEAALEVQLLDRSKRRIRLTEAGADYFELCKKGLDALALANRTLRDRQTDTAGTVTITVPPNLAEILFLEPIETFLERYGQARIRVFVSERMLDFTDDAIDLSFRVARPTRPDLVIRKLITHRHRLVAAPAYLALSPPPREPQDLREHRRLGFGFQERGSVTWSLSKGGSRQELTFEPDLALNDYAGLKAAVLRGLGIGELPGLLCRKDIEAGRLTEVLPLWRFPEITVYAVHTGSPGLSRLARLFLDIVAESLKVGRG
jgi:DNA-binding transcriptional LysR family regulator